MTMSTIKRVLLFTLASMLISAVVGVDPVLGAAQRRWGSEAMPQAGVCFFSDTNFRGRYFCLGPREDLAELPRGGNDEISSIRVIGNLEVMVFRDVRFRGPEARFFTDMPDLRREGWNDAISSIRVTGRSVAWDRERLPAWGREGMPREGACFYRNVNFDGDYFCVPRGASFARLPPGFEDQISSIRLVRAAGVMVFRDRDFDGRNARLTSDVPDLRRGRWNDRIASIRVY
jgi:hypothetical protein